MEAAQILKEKKIFVFIVLIFFVGILGHSFNLTFDLMIFLTPFTLLLIGIILLFYIYFYEDKHILIWSFFVFIITVILEIIGVKTGSIFGNYFYGDTLGLKFFEVPLIIGFNWMFVILGAINFTQKIIRTKFIVPLFAANLCVAFDLALEPVAIKLNYWNWQNGNIPLQNYFAWFLISFLAAITFSFFNFKIKSNLLAVYFFVQLIFFLFLNIIL